MNNQTGKGYLRVWVTSAGGTLPVVGVPVQILDDNGNLLHVLRTGEGGLTPTVTLAAPAASEGLTPGTKPYRTYGVRVERDGYVPIAGIQTPIFDGITAVQPVTLLPVTQTGGMAPNLPPLQLYPSQGYQRIQEGGGNMTEMSAGRGTPEIDRLTLDDEEDI